jgi:hypothetical protein
MESMSETVPAQFVIPEKAGRRLPTGLCPVGSFDESTIRRIVDRRLRENPNIFFCSTMNAHFSSRDAFGTWA